MRNCHWLRAQEIICRSADPDVSIVTVLCMHIWLGLVGMTGLVGSEGGSLGPSDAI